MLPLPYDSRRTCRWILSKFRRPFPVGSKSLLRGTIKMRLRNKCIPHCENGPRWPLAAVTSHPPRIHRNLHPTRAISSTPVTTIHATLANSPRTETNERADAIKSSWQNWRGASTVTVRCATRSYKLIQITAALSTCDLEPQENDAIRRIARFISCTVSRIKVLRVHASYAHLVAPLFFNNCFINLDKSSCDNVNFIVR